VNLVPRVRYVWRFVDTHTHNRHGEQRSLSDQKATKQCVDPPLTGLLWCDGWGECVQCQVNARVILNWYVPEPVLVIRYYP